MKNKKAIFVDRDGTMIVDVGYPKDPLQVQLLPDLTHALEILKKQNFMIIVVSNQSGIGRGLITHKEANDVHERLVNLLKKDGVTLDAVYYCPHAPEAKCYCRKPSPEMIFSAARQFGIDMNLSFMIGDREVDVATGMKAGCRTVLIEKNHQEIARSFNPDYLAEDWNDVVRYIIEFSKRSS